MAGTIPSIGDHAHGAAAALIGRDHLLAQLDAMVTRGTSVLLVGPPGAGKSALIEVVARGADVGVLDPFEGISPMHAARIRRRLDRGAVMIGATRRLDRRHLGAVGRIVWRFQIVRVPPLAMWQMAAVMRGALAADIMAASGIDAWIRDLAARTGGLPGRGRAFAEAGHAYWQRTGVLPSPEWTIVDALATDWASAAASQP